MTLWHNTSDVCQSVKLFTFLASWSQQSHQYPLIVLNLDDTGADTFPTSSRIFTVPVIADPRTTKESSNEEPHDATKFHIWRFNCFESIAFFDVNRIWTQNADHIFSDCADRAMCALRNPTKAREFSSDMFVTKPSRSTFDHIMQEYYRHEHESDYLYADRDFLNHVFASKWTVREKRSETLFSFAVVSFCCACSLTSLSLSLSLSSLVPLCTFGCGCGSCSIRLTARTESADMPEGQPQGLVTRNPSIMMFPHLEGHVFAC